ncbi:hypothetical protein V3C99_017075 [Haemonchus contortus]
MLISSADSNSKAETTTNFDAKVFSATLERLIANKISSNYEELKEAVKMAAAEAKSELNDPLTVIRPILDVCGMSNMAVTDHRAWKLREETAIQSQCIAPLDDVQRQRVKLLVEYLQQDWCR